MGEQDYHQAIWQAYIKGDDNAFENLYKAYASRLFIYGCNLTSDEALVKDAIQEIFLKLYQKDKSLIDIHNIRSYLFVALRNHVRKSLHVRRNQFRHQKAYQELQPRSEFSLPVSPEETSPSSDEFMATLKTEVDQLPGRQREVICLKFFEGFDYHEITSIMAISYQVARNYVSRGMKRLRAQMAEEQAAGSGESGIRRSAISG
ncbi:MAG: RNA polymerase sigma factor [Lewinellaceae bacterium]|nr:RNA polymerase sigma factor [Lewinellaceae bacterium]